MKLILLAVTVLLTFAISESNAQSALEIGENFLAQNGKEDGVVTLESGLQYKMISDGLGDTPGPDDKVKVHYKGTLTNGEVFDSSYERGAPISFKLNQVIKGWQEALQLMPVGAKWKLFIPSELAYGKRGTGAQIPPDAVLIFEVELIDIEY